jgi:hypothetical protein
MRRDRLFLLPVLFGIGLFIACSEDTQRPKTEAGTADQAVGEGAQVKQVEDYVPAANEVSGWAEDLTKGKPCPNGDSDCVTTTGAKCDTTSSYCVGAEFGHTTKEIDDIIDGKHDPYALEGCKGFAIEFYTKDLGSGCTGTVQLYIWEMNTATGALNMYNYNKSSDETDAGITFEAVQTVQTAGIIGDDAPGFRAYAHKNAYMLYIWAEYSDAACKDTLKAETITWLEHVTQNLP